jgi:hypothetical protein
MNTANDFKFCLKIFKNLYYIFKDFYKVIIKSLYNLTCEICK